MRPCLPMLVVREPFWMHRPSIALLALNPPWTEDRDHFSDLHVEPVACDTSFLSATAAQPFAPKLTHPHSPLPGKQQVCRHEAGSSSGACAAERSLLARAAPGPREAMTCTDWSAEPAASAPPPFRDRSPEPRGASGKAEIRRDRSRAKPFFVGACAGPIPAKNTSLASCGTARDASSGKRSEPLFRTDHVVWSRTDRSQDAPRSPRQNGQRVP